MTQRITFFIALFLIQVISSQEITVLDVDTNEPIVNVAVYNNDKSKTALTDFDGICDLTVFDKNERITFHHVSYEIIKSTKNQILRNKSKMYLAMNAQQLDEVVMSVSKWEQQKKNIPNKIVSIDAREIAFTNPQTSADVLQSSGKVFVQKSQLGGGSPMIRGFATNRLLITVDGVRMNNAIFRGGNIQNVISVDPFSIKNTEIIFGPGSVIYGSDAIGGVMNFYTKDLAYASTDSTLINGKALYRFSTANNENTFHFDINYGRKQWAFLTSVSYNDFGNLEMGKYGPDVYLRNTFVERINGQDILTPNENPKEQIKTGYSQLNLLQKIGFKPNNTWKFDLGLYYSETSDYSRYDRLIRPNSTGNGLRSAEWYYGPQKWFMSNFQIHKKGKGKFYDGLRITSAYQHFEESRNNRDFQDVVLNRTKEKLDALSLNVDFENKRIGDLRLYYGGEYLFNKVHSNGSVFSIESNTVNNAPSRYPDGAQWQSLAGYLNAEYKAMPNLTILTGMRYSHVWVNANFDNTFYDFPFDEANVDNGALTGSLGLSWFPKADMQITWNASTGFRSPNIDDIGKVFDSEPGSVVVPNPDLEPEYAYNTELGIRKNFADKVVLKGATFYTYLVDALVRRDFQFNGVTEIDYFGELSNVQAIQNAAKAYVYGFEFGVEAFLNDNLSIASNLTITEGIEEDSDGIDTPGRHVAPTFGDFHVIWNNQKLKTDFYLNYNGKIAFDDLAPSEQNKAYLYAIDANGNPFSPSWYTLNLRSDYSISKDLSLNLSLENITNQRYRTYSSGISAPGINFITGLRYKF